MENLIWAAIPIAAVSAPFLFLAFSKWIEYKKATGGAMVPREWETRFAECEDALTTAQRRIEKLETVVANRLLLDARSGSDDQIDVSEKVAPRIVRQVKK